MISDFIITLVTGLLGAILTALPAFTLPSELTSTLPTQFGTWVSWANGYFPIYHVGIAIGILIGLRVLLAVWRICVWLYDKFPFKFT